VDRGEKRIAVITHGGKNDAFWDILEDGVERAAQNLAAQVDYITTEGSNYEGMRSRILEQVGEGVDGLIVSMPNREILWGAVQEAIDSGIPVVAINSCDNCITAPDGSPTGILAWFGSDDVTAGELACQQFRKRGISKVIAIDSESGGNSALLDRVKGCNAVPGINATRVDASKNDIQLQRAAIDDALAKSGPDTGVLTLGPFGSSAVPQNVTAWITFDFSTKTAEQMEEGRILAAIDQQQYLQGYLSVNYMVNLLAYGQRVLKREIYTGPDLITSSDKIRSRECIAGGVWFEGEPPPKQKGIYLSSRDAAQEEKCPAIDRNEYSITMVTTGTDASPYWRQIKNGAEVAAQDIGVKLNFKQDRQETGVGLSELFSPAELAEIAVSLGPKHGLIISTSSLTYPKQSQSGDSPETQFLASLNLTSDRPVLIYGVGGETGILEIGKRDPIWLEVEGGRVEGLGPVLLVGGLRDDTVETTGDLLLSAARMKDRADEVCTRGMLCMDPRLGTDKELLQMCNATADSLSGQCKALNISSEALSATEAPFDGSSQNSVLAKRDELLQLTSQMEFGSVLALGPNGWQPDVITLGPTATSVFGFDAYVYDSLVDEVKGLELDFATQNQPFIAAYWAVLSMALALITDQTLAVNNILDTGPFVLWNARDLNGVQRFTTKPNPEKALNAMQCSLAGLAPCNPVFTKNEGFDKGALVAIIVGTWVVIAIIVGGVVYLISRRNARRLKREAENWRVSYSELEGMENAELLGEGGFGRVVKARFRGSEVAVKSIWTQPSLKASSHAGPAPTGSKGRGEAAMDLLGMRPNGKSRSDKKSRKMVDKELRTMAKMRHPNILGLMAATVHPRTREVLLISELMTRGSMQMLIDQNAPLDMVTLLTGLVDVARGMNFLHSSNVVHGDIKPANILVDDNYHCKLGDFGFSRELGALAFGGTPEYMAPECLDNPVNQTPASDMYSFAISVWQIVSRERPFDSRLRSDSLQSDTMQGNESQNVADFLSGMGKVVRDRTAAVKAAHDAGERPDLAAMKRARRDCPDALIGLIEECWQTTPGDRPSFEQIALRLEAILAKEREKSRVQNQDQDLLYRMMPPRVAEQLKAGQRVEAENFDSVTIFFSDVCGYTELSSSLPPQEVMAMMDRLFSAMDALSTKYGLFKVETIGDAYFCVGNLEPPQENHAAQVLRFAQEVVAAVSGMPLDPKDPRKGCFKIRIGIHTGAVLGSVVGDLNPRYCLFGDAVNTASRMESSSKPLGIHLSQQAYVALAQQDRQLASTCTRRGVISVKGKGRMVTYWGHAAESGASPTDSPRATSSPEAGQSGMDSAAALNTFFLQHRLPKPAARELLVLLAAPEFSLEEVARQGEGALLGGLRGL